MFCSRNFLLFFIVLAFVFCLVPVPDSQAEKFNYKRELKKWTRSDEVYQRDDFYASLSWSATYQGPRFVRAKVRKMAEIYDDGAERTEHILNAELNKFSRQAGFYVSFYAYNGHYADLSQKRNGWRLTLWVNGRRYEPDKFEKFTKVRPLYQELYPYSNQWSRHYYVYFPLPVSDLEGAAFELRIRGPTGESSLRWNDI